MADNMEETVETVELVDENGKAAQFEHLMTLEYEGADYIVLYPLDDVEGVNEDEVMIMRVDSSGEEDMYLPVEDDETLNEIFAVFLENYEELEDGEEDE
jgi:uncharacterized protein YrzB (UPF0473 family)